MNGIDAATGMVTSSSYEDHTRTNRVGIVHSVPFRYDGPIREGSRLLVHHNTFRYYNTLTGDKVSSGSFFRDGTFVAHEDNYFAYDNGDGWVPVGRYCLVKPIPIAQRKFYVSEKNQPLTGEMMAVNGYLYSQGVRDGDIVTFKPEGEYEFNVDGIRFWRMFDHFITAKYG